MKFKDTEYGDMSGQHYEGDINIDSMGVSDWEGSPASIWGRLSAANNEFTTLVGMPEMKKGSSISLNDNPLGSLKGAKWTLIDDFGIVGCGLTSFEGCPQKVIGMFAGYNNDCVSLTGVSPYISGRFFVNNCKIETIGDYMPQNEAKWLNFEDNPNKYLDKEYRVRVDGFVGIEFYQKMYELTGEESYLPDDVHEMFLF